MGRLIRAIEKRATVATGGSLENPANWMVRMFGLQNTAAGNDVNERNGLYSIDVLTCVRIIAETLAQLPFPLYRRLPKGGKERATNHPLYRVLQEQANDEMTAFTFKETLAAHLLTWGNAYAYIERDPITSDVVALWPLLPDRTFPFRVNGELKYQTSIKKLPLPYPGEFRVFEAKDIFHIPGLGFDGLIGYSVIQYLREQIGVALAQDEYQARLYSNGSVPPAYITTPKSLGPEDIKRLQTDWDEAHRGVKRSWMTAVLEEGMDIKTLGMPPQDAQFMELRRFSSEKIYGFYRVPPHMVGDTSKATSYGTGIAQQEVGFAQYTIQPWAVRIEHAVDMKLLLRPRDDRYFAEFLMAGIQRGDIATRYNAYVAGWGKWLTTNDIRELETMNPYAEPEPGQPELPVGDRLIWPLNMTTAELLVSGETIKKLPAPGEAPAPEPAPVPTKPAPADPSEQSSLHRRALARAQRVAFVDVAERVLRREQADVLRARPRDRVAWLEAFYTDHATFIERQVGPQLRTLAELVGLDVARETGLATARVTPTFVDAYVESYGRRHAQASLRELRDLPADALDATFAGWAARPGWVADRETIQAVNAFARAAYRELGIAQIRWFAGDECESCRSVNGKAIAVDAVFVKRGEGAPDAFIPIAGLGHPPLCDGCGCVILAVPKP